VLGIGRIAHEHPLTHGICGQLLCILYLAELDGIDGHALAEAKEKGRVRENVRDDDVEGHFKLSFSLRRPLYETDTWGVYWWGLDTDPCHRPSQYLHSALFPFPFSAPRRDDVWFLGRNEQFFPPSKRMALIAYRSCAQDAAWRGTGEGDHSMAAIGGLQNILPIRRQQLPAQVNGGQTYQSAMQQCSQTTLIGATSFQAPPGLCGLHAMNASVWGREETTPIIRWRSYSGSVEDPALFVLQNL